MMPAMNRVTIPQVVLIVVFGGGATLGASPSKVTFNEAGIAVVDGKPFFPVGLYTYDLNSQVMAEIHEQQMNTIIGSFGLKQLDYIREHGLMAVCPTGEEWLKAARTHPALLGWYLTDEPEGHGNSPAGEHERYLKLKQQDPDHPIGLCHFLFDALAKYKDGADFTMTDVYPVTANRDVPLRNVGIHIDEARRVHGPNWPNWAYIQVFGGPDTDGGKWAQPLPHEVRCMTYIALVHRTTGILYFSYWPKAPRTWESIGPLNREIHRLVPWLVAPGKEVECRNTASQVHLRMRRTEHGGILLAVNTEPTFTEIGLAIPDNPATDLEVAFAGRKVVLAAGRLRDRLGPYEPRVYLWGTPPRP